MTIKKLKRKPVILEGVIWTGNNLNEVRSFMKQTDFYPKVAQNRTLKIKTLNGIVYVKEGEWIIKGIKGEFYPCDPEVIKETYEILY